MSGAEQISIDLGLGELLFPEEQEESGARVLLVFCFL